ncbi:anti-sigma factor [Salipiger sp. P9]|uniref:anti-sigma factor n=1 Tax=Salipiger pentaromativorans TaxID=2943193 RepID=UPI002157EC5B|nr:anti-sigma factor [Salipiger pentaromativorans]MCR8550312.1 anti-sigma factor [Salipiger pentaromativorans]
MTGLTEDDIALAGEYALGALPPEERAALSRRAETDPAFAAEVAAWETALDPLNAELPPVAPPPAAWRGLEKRLFPTAERPASPWRWLAAASGLSAAVLAAVLWLGQPAPPRPEALWISDMASEDGSVRVAALYDAARGEMRVSMGGAGPGANRDFELWLLGPDGGAVSLGLLPRDGQAAMAIPEGLRGAMAAATLAITDEPEGGAPGGVATGPVIATAVLRRI